MQGTQEPDPGTSAQRLAAMRRLRFIWLPVEAGAPAVDPWQPFGSPDALEDLSAVAGTRDEAALQRLYCEVMNGLPRFVAAAAARLAPGCYALDEADVERLQEFMFDEDPGVGEDGSFEYAAEHAVALPRLNWKVLDGTGVVSRRPLTPDQVAPNEDGDGDEDRTWPVVAVSAKRPYGDEGDPEPSELHRTIPVALRVVVLHGET